ncbi:hypothetical protein ACR2V4_27185, partial [Klebsiella pneumoniae]
SVHPLDIQLPFSLSVFTMAETPSKRQREETHLSEDIEDPKRHKSYTQILSLLEEEEEEPTEDFSSILTTLQRELSCDSESDPSSVSGSEPDPDSYGPIEGPVPSEDDERERVLRHLLEASDYELGIPNRSDVGDDGEAFHDGDFLDLGDGLWELEDEAANYYTLVQSELFL